MSIPEIIVGDRAYEYLRVQKGSLDKISARPMWQMAYRDALDKTVASLVDYLPQACRSILDVGSGLGGIDILLHRLYRERKCVPSVHLLDGLDDPPRMNLHRETFNNMEVAQQFLSDNGIPPWLFYAYGPDPNQQPVGKYDLIVSFGAWCFHLEPRTYLPFVRTACHPGTTLILEVRTSKDLWRAQLEQYFQPRAIAHEGRKFQRIVYGVKP